SCLTDSRAVDAEELWAVLFQRDWRWLCTDGPCQRSSSRQSHRRITEKAGKGCAFVVLGGCVRRAGGRHADGAVLSVLTSDQGKVRWRSHSGLLDSRCAAGICCSGSASAKGGRVFVAGGFNFSEEEPLGSCEAIDVADLLSGQPVVQECPFLQHPRACPGLAAASE
ncbi:unnamed protein product, partial [Effrenium voratum]